MSENKPKNVELYYNLGSKLYFLVHDETVIVDVGDDWRSVRLSGTDMEIASKIVKEYRGYNCTSLFFASISN